MQEERKFPLMVWEATGEYREEYEKAQERFENIRERLYKKNFECTALFSLQFDINGYPEVWLNSSSGGYRGKWTVEEAISHAVRHGDTGWWSLDELEQFVHGKGPIFEEGMWELGFRRHKLNPEKWARLESKEKGEGSLLRQKRWHEKNDRIYGTVSDDKAKELIDLLTLPNEFVGLGKTYSIQVGKRGMVYIELEANPFAGTTTETLYILGNQLSNKGHIATWQDGYHLNAANLKLGKKDVVYIEAMTSDKKSNVERVWPSQIAAEKIYDLADDLVSKVKRAVVHEK